MNQAVGFLLGRPLRRTRVQFLEPQLFFKTKCRKALQIAAVKVSYLPAYPTNNLSDGNSCYLKGNEERRFVLKCMHLCFSSAIWFAMVNAVYLP